MNTRKLASIEVVNSIEAIPNADQIEKIRVLGWWVVVKKNEYKLGDKLVYCEIDSLLPEKPEFEFLRSNSYKPAQATPEGEFILPAGFRIRTVKLRGQVSQGICFPLSILPVLSEVINLQNLPTGTDVTDLLSIRKWEPPVPIEMRGRVKGRFPSFLPKTNEVRVQVLEEVLLKHKGKIFYATEKLDGTSFTAFVRHGEFGICSRNLHMDETDESNMHSRAAIKYQLKEKMLELRKSLDYDYAIQAELIGPGIQKNKYNLNSIELRVFNVLNLDSSKLLDLYDSDQILDRLGLGLVPYLRSIELNHTVDELVTLSEGISQLNHQIQREGIVLRPYNEEYDETIGGRLSFKVINPKFLLKYDE